MFDISWTDPQRETVAQRSNRKQNQARGSPRESSSRASGSESAESELRYKPDLLTLFDSSNKKFSTDQASLRSESTSSQSIYSRTLTATTSTFPLTPDSVIHSPSTSTSLSFSFDHGALKSPLKSPHIASESDTSPTNTAGLDLSAWTGSSTPTESTDSFTEDSPTSKWFLIQPLSPRSYVSQTTEITSSPRASIADSESLTAVSVRIFAETCDDPEEDTPTQRPSIFDIPLRDPDALSIRSREKNCDYKSKPSQTLSSIKSRENLWSPPQDWDCSQEKLPTGSPTSIPGSPLSKSLSNQSEHNHLELMHIRPNLLRVDSGHSQDGLEDSQQIWADDIGEARYYELAVRNRL